MSRPSSTELLWALFLLVLGAVGWTIFRETDYLSILLPSFAVVATAAFAVGSRLAGRHAQEVDAVTDVSWPTVLVAIALSLALFGLEVGIWLVYAGGGLVAFGGGGLVREWTAQRRATR